MLSNVLNVHSLEKQVTMDWVDKQQLQYWSVCVCVYMCVSVYIMYLLCVCLYAICASILSKFVWEYVTVCVH